MVGEPTQPMVKISFNGALTMGYRFRSITDGKISTRGAPALRARSARYSFPTVTMFAFAMIASIFFPSKRWTTRRGWIS